MPIDKNGIPQPSLANSKKYTDNYSNINWSNKKCKQCENTLEEGQREYCIYCERALESISKLVEKKECCGGGCCHKE